MTTFPWTQAIDKKVKSSDDKDLGKIQSVSRDFIETKEGKVSANHYFIPKYFVEGYDDDGNIIISLDKDDAGDRFKGDSPKDAELAGTDYLERKRAISALYPDFEANIPPFHSATEADTGTLTETTVSSPAEADRAKVLPWERIVDKKVKAQDGDEVGKVKSISPDFIEVEEGTVNKKRFFIPKYYIEGFDGDNVHLASPLSKSDIEERYERETPPTESEIRTPDYLERVHAVESRYPQFVHGVPWMAEEPETEIPVDYSGSTYNIPWDKLIHQHVRSSDNVEVGYVERIGDEFIVAREGTSGSGHIYYVPKTYIRDYDGSQLWIDAPSDLVRAKFEMEEAPSREEMRELAHDAPRLRREELSSSGRKAEASTVNRGPAVMWTELKGKNVKTSEGVELGEVKDISQNYIRVEKGTIKKSNKFWLPKFLFDVYDGKNAWLVTSDEQTRQYLKGEEPAASSDYAGEFERFRTGRPSFGRDPAEGIAYRSEGEEKVRGYKNIRELD